ncbi:MAG TPA: hypothetical protein VE954_24010 [Oligoflexus sp.]|uniref:hypothetical protein n=1 Tax=Oligoflexus sp. TaxID=1971216 RepID=UPI002D67A473|nr:hypothetical protein [Oligoflexus sp.]HYX36179.1 hypothetical protein [Oligoflexus sp.]
MNIVNLVKKTALAGAATASIHTTALSDTMAPEALLAKPLITGASVSADWSTASPGKTLALRYTGKSHIKTIAFGGRTGRDVIKEIKPKDVQDRTIIMAVDFLFWDSTLTEAEPSIKALENLMSQASNLSLPIVLGEIPELLPGRQVQRQRLNQEITQRCASYKQCFLMPFNQLHEQVSKDGYLEIKGRKYSMKDLVPDGLHLSVPTSEYLADMMLALLNRKEIKSDGKFKLP